MAMAAASIAVAAPLRASASASPRASRSRAAAARPRVAAPRASPLAPRTRKGAAVRAAAAAADSSDATAKKKKKDPAAAGKKTGASATSAENADASAGSSSSSSSPSKNEKAKEALAAALRSGDAVVGRVEVANRGGLILRIFNGRYRAFLPLSQMASSRTAAIKGGKSKAAAQLKRVTAPLASFDDDDDGGDFAPPTPPPSPPKPSAKDATVAALEQLVGTNISVRVTDVNDKKIVVSERALVQDVGAKALKPGDVARGAVMSMSDFGAFVEILPDDARAPRCEGLIHISELSWNRVSHPRDVVKVGDVVSVKVLETIAASGNGGDGGGNGGGGGNKERGPRGNASSTNARVTFSLKQLTADPLLETLDTIMPVAMPEPSVDDDELADAPLPGLNDICANLLAEDGIDAVIPGRQAIEQRVVSQDLELWLTNANVEDGYNLLARAGRQVQEIHVVTELTRDAIKVAIKRATSALK